VRNLITFCPERPSKLRFGTCAAQPSSTKQPIPSLAGACLGGCDNDTAVRGILLCFVQVPRGLVIWRVLPIRRVDELDGSAAPHPAAAAAAGARVEQDRDIPNGIDGIVLSVMEEK